MATREYVVGKYEEYYNSLKGEVSASSKASDFISEVSRLCTEFDNVTQIMTYWEGEAKSAMCADGISSVMEKFKSTQANLNDALAPVCEAIGVLSDSLDKMKTTEDTWLQKKSDLSSLKNKEPSQTKSDGSTNPEYSSWKSNYDKLNSEIDSLKKELDGLKAVCDDSIAKIESLEGSLREFSDYMEMTNSILGIGSTDFSSYSLEQRLTYLQELIDNYQTIYDSLNEVYQQRYGHGFKYTAADFKQLDFLFDAFDLYWMSKVDRKNVVKSENGGLVVFDIDNLIKVLSYCNANDVFTKIESYMNGASWEKSGLESLYSGQFLDTDSANFMNTQAFNESRFKKRLKENYGVTGDPREYLKKNFDSIVSSYEKMMNAYGEYQKLAGAMAAVRCQIDSVKEAKKLMPYEMNMEKSDFKSYLSKDYSGYSLLSQEQLSVMSQQEVALYDYLYHTKSKKEAEAYLKAMENTMNQRIGAYRATEYVEYLRQGGYGIDDLLVTGWEGLKDGVSNFFDGIADLFRVSSTEAGTKTAFDYEMMYKVQFMTELMNDPTYVKPGTSKKTFGFGDLTNWYNTGTSVGNMVVPSIVSFIPVVGKPLSTSLMTLSIAGNSAVQAKQEGYSTAQAYIYGALSGASETFTEVTLGGIPGISNLEGKGVLGSMFSEGLEEFTQEYLDVGLRWIVLGEEPESGAAAAHERFANAFRAGAQGFITSGVMQGGNTVMGLGVNTVTRALSPTVTTSNGDVIKKYNSYGEFKNGVESNFYTPRAASAINDAVTRTANGESLSLTDKIKLNRAISNVSAEELSNITHDLSTEQRTALNDALSGIPKMSTNSSEKIDNAAVLASAAEATDISNISGLTEDSLNATVTRDGRSLAQYLADNKAGMMNENAIRTIEEISPEAASEIVSRMEANQKAYEKKMAKAERHGAPTTEDIASVLNQYENATQHTQTSAQQTNNSGVNDQANVQQNNDVSGAVNDSASGSSSYVESYPTQTGGSSEYVASEQRQSNNLSHSASDNSGIAGQSSYQPGPSQNGGVRTNSQTFDSNAQVVAQNASYSAAVQQSAQRDGKADTPNSSVTPVQQNNPVSTKQKADAPAETTSNQTASTTQNPTNKSRVEQTESSVEQASEVVDSKTRTQESDTKTSEKAKTKGQTYDTVSQGMVQNASYSAAVQQSVQEGVNSNDQVAKQTKSTNKGEITDTKNAAETKVEASEEQNPGNTLSKETAASISSESSIENSDPETKVASAAAPATLGWQYTLQNNSNAGKKGTVININMDLINKSLTPDGNLKVAEQKWNAAGKPKSGQVYEAYQSAYAFAHLAGGTNTNSIAQLHQQDGNINYNTSVFKSSTTTKQGMSPSDFSNLVQTGALSASMMAGLKASDVVDNSTNNSKATDNSQSNPSTLETKEKNITPEESEDELTEKIAESIDLQEVGEKVLQRINSADDSSETDNVSTKTEDGTLEASEIANAIDFESIADDLLNQLNSKKSSNDTDTESTDTVGLPTAQETEIKEAKENAGVEQPVDDVLVKDADTVGLPTAQETKINEVKENAGVEQPVDDVLVKDADTVGLPVVQETEIKEAKENDEVKQPVEGVLVKDADTVGLQTDQETEIKEVVENDEVKQPVDGVLVKDADTVGLPAVQETEINEVKEKAEVEQPVDGVLVKDADTVGLPTAQKTKNVAADSVTVNPFIDTEVTDSKASQETKNVAADSVTANPFIDQEATDAKATQENNQKTKNVSVDPVTANPFIDADDVTGGGATITGTGVNITDSFMTNNTQTKTSVDTLSTLTELTPAQVLDVLNTLPDSSIKNAVIDYISNSSNLISVKTVQQIQELCNLSAEFADALLAETGMTVDKFVEQCKTPIAAYSTSYEFFKTEANLLMNKVKTIEPSVTSLLQSLAVNGAELVGLDHRFKTFNGIFKKMVNTNSSFINDALRYTMILDPKTYSADVVSKLETLYDAGYKIDYINNSWGNSKYQGLNVGLVTPGGLVIELQFHTKESFAVKEFMSHDYYDIAKSTNTPYSLVKQANAIMELAQSTFNSIVPSDAKALSKTYIESNFAKYEEFASYNDFASKYGKQAAQWFNGLAPEVQSLFYHYVGESNNKIGGYKTLNAILRNIFLSPDGNYVNVRGTSGYPDVYPISKFEGFLSNKMTVHEFISESIKAAEIMTKAAGTNTFMENTKIYRGIYFDALAEYGIKSSDPPDVIYQKLIAKGQFYHDDAFMSSSPSPSWITNDKPVILDIKALKGTTFIDLNYINSSEREILFPPGSSFHIDGVSKDSHGKIIIHLKSVVNSAATQTSTVKAPVTIPMPNLGSLINVHNDYANGFQYSIYDSSFAVLEESVANHSVQEIYTEVSNEYINCDITANAIIATVDKMISENSPHTNKYIASVTPVLIASGKVDYISELKSKLSPAAVTEIPSLMSTFDLKAANTFDAIPMKQTPDNENLIKSASHYKTLLAIETTAELYEDLVKKLNNNETSIENIEQIVDHLFENEYKEDFLAAVIPIMISKGNIPFLTSVKALLSDSQIKQINKHMNKISSSAVSFFDSLEPAPLVFGKPLPTFLKSVQNENVFNLYEKVQNGLANSTITIEQCKIAADAMLENGSPSTTDFFAAIIPTLIQNGDTAYIAEFKGKLGDMQSTFTGLALTFISPDDVSVFDSITPVESNQESNTGSVVDNQSNDTHLSDATSSEYVTTFNDTISVNKDGVSEIDFEALDNLINANTQYTLYQLIYDDIFFCSASDILKAVEGLIAENSPETIKFTSAAVPALVEYGQTEVVEKIKNIFSAEQQAVLVQEIAKISENASQTFANLGNTQSVANTIATATGKTIDIAEYEKAISEYTQKELYESTKTDLLFGSTTADEIIQVIDGLNAKNSPETIKFTSAVIPVLVEYGQTATLESIKSIFSTEQQAILVQEIAKISENASQTFANLGNPQATVVSDITATQEEYTPLDFDTIVSAYESQDAGKNTHDSTPSSTTTGETTGITGNPFMDIQDVGETDSTPSSPATGETTGITGNPFVDQTISSSSEQSDTAVNTDFNDSLIEYAEYVSKTDIHTLYDELMDNMNAFHDSTLKDIKKAIDAFHLTNGELEVKFLSYAVPVLVGDGQIQYLAEVKSKLSPSKIQQIVINSASISYLASQTFADLTPIETNNIYLSNSELVSLFENAISNYTTVELNESLNLDLSFDETTMANVVLLANAMLEEGSVETTKYIGSLAPILIENGDMETLSNLKSKLSVEQQAEVSQEIAKISEDASKTFANLGNTQSVANTIATATGKTIDIAEYEKAISEYTQKELYESTKTDLLFGSTTADEIIQVIDGLNAKNSPETIKFTSAVIPVLLEYGQTSALESIKDIFSAEQQAVLVQEVAKISEEASHAFAGLGSDQVTVVNNATTSSQEEYTPLDFDKIVEAYEAADVAKSTQDSSLEIDYTKVIKETEKTVKDMNTTELSEGFKYQILNGLTTLSYIENLANAVVEQGSEEIVKIISSTIPILYEFGETQFLTEMKNKLTVEEQAEIIAEVDTVSHEASEAFAGLSLNGNTGKVIEGVTPNFFSSPTEQGAEQTNVDEVNETADDNTGETPGDEVAYGVTPNFFSSPTEQGAEQINDYEVNKAADDNTGETPTKVKTPTMIEDVFSSPKFFGDIDAIMADASSKSDTLLQIEVSKSIKNGVHGIEYYKALVDTLIEQDVEGKEKYIASVIPSLFDANEIEYLEQLKSHLTVSEDSLVSKSLDKISVLYSDQFFDLNANPMKDEVKLQQKLAKTLVALPTDQMSETMTQAVSNNMNELKTYKSILETMIDENSVDLAKFVTGITPILVKYGDMGYLQLIKSQLDLGDLLVVQESINAISPSVAQTFNDTSVLDAELLELDKQIKDNNLAPTIGAAKLNHQDIMPTIQRYLEESLNQKNKITVIKTLLVTNQTSNIDFTKYLSASDCVSILESMYSSDVNMQFTNVDELNRFMGLIENNETLVANILNQGVSYDILNDLLSEMDCYEIEEVTNADGSISEKYIFKINGLNPKAMQNIGEMMVGSDPSITYVFESDNSEFSREQLNLLFGEYKTYKKFTDYSEFEAKYKQLINKWESSLSFEERTLFEIYSSQVGTKVGCYKTLNGILRGTAVSPDGQTITVSDTNYGPKTYTNEEWFGLTNMTIQEFQIKSLEVAEIMAKSIAKVQLLENTEIIRGITFDGLAKYGVLDTDTADQIYKKITANGHFYQDDGFMSSSSDPGAITSDKEIQLVLHCNAGTSFVDLTMSKINMNYNEHEVLLSPGVKFHIDSVVQKGGKTYIHMTTVSNTSTSVSQMANPVSPFSDDYTGTDTAAPVVATTYDSNVSPFGDDYTGTDNAAEPAVAPTYDTHVSPFSDDYTETDAAEPAVTPTYDTHVSPFSDDYVGTGTASLSETTEELVLDTTGNVKNSDLYIKAPLEFTTAVDGVFKYANSILGTPSCHAKIAAAFMKHLDYVASVSSFSDAKYYAFLSLNCEELPANDYSKAVVQLINADQNLRELISEKALEEITKAFGPLYGITDTETFEELRDCLLGDRFIQDGLGHGSDWNRFIELVTDPMLVATQNSVNNNKEPVIWSGFEDEYHAEMDKVFTTIANTSIAGIDFIENVYTDWYGAATPFSSSKLWANLSVAYANACSTVINPATGQVYDSIKFLYPLGKNVTDMFGELFKTCELPTIVANGTIKTITLSATDPGTMKVLSTVDIDITELIDYYLKYSIPGVVDNAINDKLFEMFYEKVKEVM